MTQVLIYPLVVLGLAFATSVGAKRWLKAKPGVSPTSVLGPSMLIVGITASLVIAGVVIPRFLQSDAWAGDPVFKTTDLPMAAYRRDARGPANMLAGLYTDCVFIRQEAGATFADAKRSCAALMQLDGAESFTPGKTAPDKNN